LLEHSDAAAQVVPSGFKAQVLELPHQLETQVVSAEEATVQATPKAFLQVPEEHSEPSVTRQSVFCEQVPPFWIRQKPSLSQKPLEQSELAEHELPVGILQTCGDPAGQYPLAH
jgi:hypothetical protein